MSVQPGEPEHDYPCFATEFDRAGARYVDEEFFIEGVANRHMTARLTPC